MAWCPSRWITYTVTGQLEVLFELNRYHILVWLLTIHKPTKNYFGNIRMIPFKIRIMNDQGETFSNVLGPYINSIPYNLGGSSLPKPICIGNSSVNTFVRHFMCM